MQGGLINSGIECDTNIRHNFGAGGQVSTRDVEDDGDSYSKLIICFSFKIFFLFAFVWI